MKVSQKEIYDYLISKGLSRNHALGMIANIKAESSFDSGAEGDLENGKHMSFGLFQHYGDRKQALLKYVQKTDEWKNSKPKDTIAKIIADNWKLQIDFALQEDEGVKYKNSSFDSPQEASESFTMNFEKPYSTTEKRKEEAKKRLSFFGKEFEVDKKVEFKDLEGKEISIKGESYLLNPGGKIDGKDIIIKKEDYDNHVIGGFGNQDQRDKAYKDYSNEIEREGYSIENFTEDVRKILFNMLEGYVNHKVRSVALIN